MRNIWKTKKNQETPPPKKPLKKWKIKGNQKTKILTEKLEKFEKYLEKDKKRKRNPGNKKRLKKNNNNKNIYCTWSSFGFLLHVKFKRPDNKQ